MNSHFSDFIVYADESGDHGLVKMDKDYPVFCLALCLIKKEYYIEQITPAMQRLKFDFWGHDRIVLHESEIRSEKGDFAFLRADSKIRQEFYNRLNKLVADARFHVVSAVIRKDALRAQYKNPFNPYHLALQFCMEKIELVLSRESQNGKKVTLIFEGRGKKEDKLLMDEFDQIVNNKRQLGYRGVGSTSIEFEIKFSGKVHNSTGLQLADMIARPIGVNVLNPSQPNRAHDIIAQKYYNGYTNKVFP